MKEASADARCHAAPPIQLPTELLQLHFANTALLAELLQHDLNLRALGDWQSQPAAVCVHLHAQEGDLLGRWAALVPVDLKSEPLKKSRQIFEGCPAFW